MLDIRFIRENPEIVKNDRFEGFAIQKINSIGAW